MTPEAYHQAAIAERDASGHALIYPGPDGVTAYRNGYPVGVVNDTNPEACDGTCRALCSFICEEDDCLRRIPGTNHHPRPAL